MEITAITSVAPASGSHLALLAGPSDLEIMHNLLGIRMGSTAGPATTANAWLTGVWNQGVRKGVARHAW